MHLSADLILPLVSLGWEPAVVRAVGLGELLCSGDFQGLWGTLFLRHQTRTIKTLSMKFVH